MLVRSHALLCKDGLKLGVHCRSSPVGNSVFWMAFLPLIELIIIIIIIIMNR